MQVNEFTLTITNFDNAAMAEDRSGEVARMLRDIAKRIEEYGIPNQDGVRLMDSNGNHVGAVAVDWDEDEFEAVILPHEIREKIESMLDGAASDFWDNTSEQNDFIILAQREGIDTAVQAIEDCAND